MPCDDDDDDDDGDGDEYTNTTFSSVCIYSYTVHQITIIFQCHYTHIVVARMMVWAASILITI
jgi:hypothetical protein